MIKYRPLQIWSILGLSLIVLFISSWLAKKGTLVLGEEHLLSFVYGFSENFRLFFLTISLLGSVWVLAIVLIALLLKARQDVAVRVMSAGLIAFGLTLLAKQFVDRPRPGELIDLLQRELFVAGNGFPSGHMALATAIVLILGAYLPKKQLYVIPVWIVAVAISRLYLGVHAPLDIVGGFCIGLLAATCVLLCFPPHKTEPKKRVVKAAKKA